VGRFPSPLEGDNLHRNVVYRDGKDRADQVLPLTTFQGASPEGLWKCMEAWEAKTGGKLLANPHNGNLANGRMFALNQFAGSPMTKEWAQARQRWEPLFEAIQMKGQSESHPSLSTTAAHRADRRRPRRISARALRCDNLRSPSWWSWLESWILLS
jgi:hypothetical protein